MLLGIDAVDFILRTEQREGNEICYFNTKPGRKGKAVDVLPAKESLTRLLGSPLDSSLKEKTMKILLALFECKARAHGQPLEEVQFRYEGRVDTLVDALGAA